jgi:hypothetical protein
VIATLINRIKSTKLSKLIIALFFITLLSLLYLYIFVSQFLPFATYTKSEKVAITLVSLVIIFIAIFLLYWQLFYDKVFLSKKIWQNLIIAITFSTIIFSFTYAHTPPIPVESKIIISTYDEIGFMHINRQNYNGSGLYATSYEFVGEWNQENGIVVHKGSRLGQIINQEVAFVSNDFNYNLVFVPQNLPARIWVEVDGLVNQVEIPDEENFEGFFKYTIKASPGRSISSFWQAWVTIFPMMRWLSLFVFYLASSILIFDQKLKRYEQLFYLGLLLIVSFLSYNALIFQNEFINFQNFSLVWLLISAILVIFVPLFILIFLKHHQHHKFWFFLLFLVMAVGLRVYWILMVPSGQISDFGLFHNWALQIAEGQPGVTLTKHATFTRMLSLLYRIYPSELSFEILNILFSLITMFCIWMIGKTLEKEDIGLLGTYLFAIFPPQIGMVSLICSDLFATSFFSLTTLLLVLFIRRNKWFYLIGSAFIFGIAVAIRSPLVMYSPVFLVIVYPFLKKVPGYKTIGLRTLLIGFGFLAGFILIKGIVSTVKVDNMIIDEDRNVIGPLMMGTNFEWLGRHNLDDSRLLYSWEGGDINQNGIKLVLGRLTQHPLEFINILKYKYAHMFGNATYVADVAFLDEGMNYQTFETNWLYDTYKIRIAVAELGQYSYIFITLLALGICYLPVKKLQMDLIIMCLLIIFFSIFAHTFFEVQPRYFRPVIPYVILFASMSLHGRFRMIDKP